jgi:hypothetical protein
MTSAFNFRLETNSPAILYLSSDENPANKVLIATSTVTDSNRIVLQNNTKWVKERWTIHRRYLLFILHSYYILCVGSTNTGNFYLTIKAAMQPLNARTGVSSPGTSEIQQISIGANVTNEHQVI